MELWGPSYIFSVVEKLLGWYFEFNVITLKSITETSFNTKLSWFGFTGLGQTITSLYNKTCLKITRRYFKKVTEHVQGTKLI